MARVRENDIEEELLNASLNDDLVTVSSILNTLTPEQISQISTWTFGEVIANTAASFSDPSLVTSTITVFMEVVGDQVGAEGPVHTLWHRHRL